MPYSHSSIDSFTAVGLPAEAVAQNAYSVGTAVLNRYGRRKVRIRVICDQVFDLAIYESDAPFGSVGGSAPAVGYKLEADSGVSQLVTSHPATAATGSTFVMECPGCNYVLPVLMNHAATAVSAAATLSVQFFDPI
jgi:hypothetical protein